MRAGDRTEHGDQDNQNGSGRQGIAQKRQRYVLGQRLGHDAGADDGGDENARAERFGCEAPWKIEIVHQPAFGVECVAPWERPISRSLVPRESLSMLLSGRLTKVSIRFLR
ncbi:hypothetical protein ACVWXN_005280 [Bradyrhizobium sp. i1.4.4]